MTLLPVDPSETERARQELIAEMVEENGPEWNEAYKPSSFGCHELLDRTSLAMNAVHDTVLTHPGCVNNPEWYALANEAFATLYKLYQRIGEEHLDDSEMAAAMRE